MKKITRRTACKILSLGAPCAVLDPFSNLKLEQTMNQRAIPSTQEKIPVIGLGTWQTFDVGDAQEARERLKEVLKTLIKYGGSVIDSSPMYGSSEKVVGDLTTELGIKQKIFEATKVWTSGEQAGIRQMDTSMKLMQAQPIDLMQIHNLVDWKTHIKTLRKWKEAGKIRYLGITHYHQGAYSDIEKVMQNEQLDFLQINYNLLDREAEKRILPLAKDKGIAVLINRPYQGGSLFRLTKNKTFPAWAEEFDAKTWGQLFLKFILAHPTVTCVIPGTSKPKHMSDNAQAGFGQLPTDEHRKKIIDLITS